MLPSMQLQMAKDASDSPLSGTATITAQNATIVEFIAQTFYINLHVHSVENSPAWHSR
jgi:hypothetical protein